MKGSGMKALKWVIAAALVALVGTAAAAQEDSFERPTEDNAGLIINLVGSGLGIESYEGGVGFKFHGLGTWLRVGADLLYRHPMAAITIGASGAMEIHPVELGRISPYYGLYGRLSINSVRTGSGDTWSDSFTIPLSGGPIAGVEVFATPFLSFFAEYAVTAQLTANVSRSSSGGSVASNTDFDAALLAGLGNGGKVGVVVYFPWGSEGD